LVPPGVCGKGPSLLELLQQALSGKGLARKGDTLEDLLAALTEDRTLLHIDNADALLRRSGRHDPDARPPHDPDACEQCRSLSLGAFVDKAVRASQASGFQLKLLVTACSSALMCHSASADQLLGLSTLREVRVLGLTVADVIAVAEQHCDGLGVAAVECKCACKKPTRCAGACRCRASSRVLASACPLVHHQLMCALDKNFTVYQDEQDAAHIVGGERGLVEHRAGRSKRALFDTGKYANDPKVSRDGIY
jgi:hypothetical protein